MTALNEMADAALSSSTAKLNDSTSTTIKKTDPGEIFFILVWRCYELYVAISGSMKVINDKLQALQIDLSEGVKVQGYMTNTLGTKTGSEGKETVVLGGPNDDGGATTRANEIIEYLRSIGITGITVKADGSIPLTKANELITSLNSHVDLTRTSAQTESTKATSIQTSANASLDLSTTVLKTLTSARLSIAQSR